MHDVFGNALEVGDEVATIVSGYRFLVKGKVARFTAKRIVIEVPNNYGLPGTMEKVCTPNQVVKNIPAPIPEPVHEFVKGGPKVDGKLTPRPSCVCGSVMPEGIKTTPHGWFYGHTNYGW